MSTFPFPSVQPAADAADAAVTLAGVTDIFLLDAKNGFKTMDVFITKEPHVLVKS